MLVVTPGCFKLLVLLFFVFLFTRLFYFTACIDYVAEGRRYLPIRAPLPAGVMERVPAILGPLFLFASATCSCFLVPETACMARSGHPVFVIRGRLSSPVAWGFVLAGLCSQTFAAFATHGDLAPTR